MSSKNLTIAADNTYHTTEKSLMTSNPPSPNPSKVSDDSGDMIKHEKNDIINEDTLLNSKPKITAPNNTPVQSPPPIIATTINEQNKRHSNFMKNHNDDKFTELSLNPNELHISSSIIKDNNNNSNDGNHQNNSAVITSNNNTNNFFDDNKTTTATTNDSKNFTKFTNTDDNIYSLIDANTTTIRGTSTPTTHSRTITSDIRLSSSSTASPKPPKFALSPSSSSSTTSSSSALKQQQHKPKLINSKLDDLKTRLLNDPNDNDMGSAAQVLSSLRSSPYRFSSSASRPTSRSIIKLNIKREEKDRLAKEEENYRAMQEEEEEEEEVEQDNDNDEEEITNDDNDMQITSKFKEVTWNKNGKRISKPIPKNNKTKLDDERRESKRSRSGCWICRLRKKKCTEEKPNCFNCDRLNLNCYYNELKPDFIIDPEKKKLKLDEIKKLTKEAKRNAMKKKKT
ncbi:hypothetical protein KAFR_0B06270 [Kazachstania africana CBS 2517]|uniref:Zn(2)-C6 fungal-type domain-containing protein n=1 Tax=Kazachstania africana (strain ATCC 22294 / BCRC 22015 / CBS 2517 / CECT 1963 / NBRC 1671 / NRRL Y-8276) TaxID=1071382 RepID=H2ARC4_KAZAF|nr:hypothetical protein KAFR_0B06270 [Kazachstania africana CBS 2517]CCF56924.1 hypothetical protein KAFR_0B06270 [Kazachstania africana CBS 2517]